MSAFAFPIVVGSTYTWQWQPTLNGVQWDLTGAVVTFKIKDPTGAVTSYTTTVAGTPGVATSAAVVFAAAIVGDYSWCWNATQNGIPYVSQPRGFIVIG
jgi:hypothetical protein